MKRAEIETKIAGLQRMLANESDCSTLATINRCLERLIMMEADDDEYSSTPGASHDEVKASSGDRVHGSAPRLHGMTGIAGIVEDGKVWIGGDSAGVGGLSMGQLY